MTGSGDGTFESNLPEYDESLGLQDLGNELIAAAAEYWKGYQRERGGAAVVWLEGSSGELVVFTRGEYRDKLLGNVFGIDGAPLRKDFFFEEEE